MRFINVSATASGRVVLCLSLIWATGSAASAQTKDPIKIGFSMSLSGPLAPNGKQALLGMKIWEQDINAKGGLLGRDVRLVTYDDQSNPSNIPGLYTKLLEVDKVDLVASPYGSNMSAPAMPIVMSKGKLFVGLFTLGLSSVFKYPKFFNMLPTGPDGAKELTAGFFQLASRQTPKPATLALAVEDAEFAQAACSGACENAREHGVRIVFDRKFPPGTTDFSPIVRAIQATNADLVVVCSYPLSSVGIVQSATELNLSPKMFGGAMVGMQAVAFKEWLKAKLNGIVNYEMWVPTVASLTRAGEFFKKYQQQAAAEGVDPLGYYLGGWGYAYLQTLGLAVQNTGSVRDDDLVRFFRGNVFDTIMGDISFGSDGEWRKPRTLTVQYHSVKDSVSIETWRGMSYQTVLDPAQERTGDLIFPYAAAR